MNTLRTTRRQLSLTQASVAASAGISLPTLRALERGEGGVRALAAVMAVLCGAALGLAGGQMQTILDNPLAEPFTLGISAAAAFGAASAAGAVPGQVRGEEERALRRAAAHEQAADAAHCSAFTYSTPRSASVARRP